MIEVSGIDRSSRLMEGRPYGPMDLWTKELYEQKCDVVHPHFYKSYSGPGEIVWNQLSVNGAAMFAPRPLLLL